MQAAFAKIAVWCVLAVQAALGMVPPDVGVWRVCVGSRCPSVVAASDDCCGEGGCCSEDHRQDAPPGDDRSIAEPARCCIPVVLPGSPMHPSEHRLLDGALRGLGVESNESGVRVVAAACRVALRPSVAEDERPPPHAELSVTSRLRL